MIKSVQTIGDPIQLTYTEAEFEEHFDHVACMERGGTDTGLNEMLARVLASRGLPVLPEEFCWSLCRLDLKIWATVPARATY